MSKVLGLHSVSGTRPQGLSPYPYRLCRSPSAALSAIFRGTFDVWLFLATFFGGVLAHLGINLISDYYDFKKGIDTTDALSSHAGVLVNESVEPEKLLVAGLICLVIVAFCGGAILAAVGWPLVVFGLAGLIGGYSYTGGPFSYKYKALGELMISLLMGPLMVMGSYYVQTRRLDLLPFILSLPIGILVGSVTLSNNMRDVIDDRKAGIATLPMRLGMRASKWLYYSMIMLPYLIVVAIVAANKDFLPLLAILLSIPAAVKAVDAMVRTGHTAEDFRASAHIFRYPLNSIKLHLQFNLLLLLGIIAFLIIRYYANGIVFPV